MEEKKSEQHGVKAPTRLIITFTFLLACVAGLLVLAVNISEMLLPSWKQILPLEEAPVVQLLWEAVKRGCRFLRPVTLPLLFILLICFLLFTAKRLHTERRRYGRMSGGESCLVILDSLQTFCLSIIKHLPLFAMLLVTAIGINSVFMSVKQLGKIADNFKRIKELGIMVKNLSRVEDVARITMLSQSGSTTDLQKTYRIEILSESGDVVSQQQVTLKGNRIAIDSITVNFEYSEIESGQRRNIAYPYRVYSENMRPEDAIPLNCMFNDEQIPGIYCLDSSDIYGMTKDSFFQRLKELFEIIKDDDLSREMGIRSANGTVSHFIMNAGDIYNISVQATGGLTVHKKVSLD